MGERRAALSRKLLEEIVFPARLVIKELLGGGCAREVIRCLCRAITT